jgi:hypothetical protein
MDEVELLKKVERGCVERESLDLLALEKAASLLGKAGNGDANAQYWLGLLEKAAEQGNAEAH